MCTFLRNSAATVAGISALLFLTSAQPASPDRIGMATINVAAAEGISSLELPPAQEAKCKSPQTDGPSLQDCLTARRAIASMSTEPRDKMWASQTEYFLQGWIESLTQRGFTARNIECRLSWCVVEAGSTQGHSLILNLIEARNRKLLQIKTLFAPDNNASDLKATDVLVVFKRYCTSTRELLDNEGNAVEDFDSQGKTC